MKVVLVVAHEKHKGAVVPVRKLPFVLGREPHCHLRAVSKLISHRHCELFATGGRLHVRDLGSTNGTFVNQQRIDDVVELRQGDVLQLGPLEFVVHIKTEVPVDSPTPLPGQVMRPDENEIAALLMEMDAQEEYQEGSTSTVVDVPLSPPVEEKPVSISRPQPPTRPTENSSDAAKSILAKYRRERK